MTRKRRGHDKTKEEDMTRQRRRTWQDKGGGHDKTKKEDMTRQRRRT